MKVRGLITKAGFCGALALTVTVVHAREVSGVSMPEVVSVAGKELRLNGHGCAEESDLLQSLCRRPLSLEQPTHGLIGQRLRVTRPSAS